MKQILFFFVLLPVLAIGQSKKDLKARIYSMQVDSANQEELVKNLQTANAAAEQTISDQLAVLREAQQEIAEMYDRISELNNQLQESGNTISSLENEMFNLTLEKEMLEFQLDNALNALSSQGQNLFQFNNQEPFNFQFEYEPGAGGYNDPNLYPIGLNSSGIMVYKLDDVVSNYGGAFFTHIIVRDLFSDEQIQKISVSLTGDFDSDADLVYSHDGNSTLVWLETDFINAVSRIIEQYNIVPLGFGDYSTSNRIERPVPVGNDVSLSIEKSEDGYKVFNDFNHHQLVSSGSFASIYNDVVEVFCLSDIDYAGHFVSQVFDYAIIVLMHKYPCQPLGETFYEPEFIGIKLE